MTKTMKHSAWGFLILLSGLITFSLALLKGQNILPFYLMFGSACGAILLAFVVIGSLRCPQCKEKLEIEPFPSSNPLPKFIRRFRVCRG